MQLRGARTALIDLKGRTLLPGFVDPHGHMMVGGLQALAANLLAPPDGEVTDIASLQRTLRDWVAANRAVVNEVRLIVGFGYDDSQLKERRHPTRDDLDAVSTEFPILLIHQSSHLAALNSRALEVAGLTAASKNPAGGVIRRREGSQEPDGVLEELAFFQAGFKILPAVGPKGMKAFAREGAKLWARYGYTTAQEGRATPGTANLLRQVADEGGYAIDVVTYPDVLIDLEFIQAGGDRLSADRWGLGPTAVALRQEGPWSYGALANHIVSVAGSGNADVNATLLNPFVSYAIAGGLSMTLQAEASRDWERKDSSVPVALIVGQVLNIGGQLVQVSGGPRYYVQAFDNGPRGWAARVGVSLLFPR